MNLGYLKSEIYNLGFSSKEDIEENIVIQAINRAIDTIAGTVKPIIGVHKISHYPLKNNIANPLMMLNAQHYSGEPISVCAKGVSYYFECDGTGEATITDDSGEIIINLISSREYKAYRGFCNGNVRITFSGQFSYNIKNIAIYAEKTSEALKDIPPYGANVFYNFKEIARDKGEIFLEFLDKYEQKNMGDHSFRNIANFDIVNNCIIRLSAFTQSEFQIYYKKLYTPITQESLDSDEIELENNLHILVPLLAAFYVWQDDEERKADKWYNDYETKRNDILSKENRAVAVVQCGGNYAY